MSEAVAMLGQAMSLQEYRDLDPKVVGGEKCEWKDGFLEPAGTWMKASERYIVVNLMDRQVSTDAWKTGSRLLPETACWLEKVNALRIPDLAYFTSEQMRESSSGEPVPPWVIEIISKSETIYQGENKVLEYFHSGVQVVWHVIPEVKKVRIFRVDGGISDHTGDQLCTASPALDEFTISVADVFRER